MSAEHVVELEPAGSPGGRDRTRGRGQPQIVIVLAPAPPRPRALHQAIWLARRLRAAALVTEVVEYPPPRDELVSVRAGAASVRIDAVTRELAAKGVDAHGKVIVTPDGYAAAAVDDLADSREADLVAVLSRHRSWLRVLPGSSVAHALTRAGRRPVVVIPDYGPGVVDRLLGTAARLRGADAAPAGSRRRWT